MSHNWSPQQARALDIVGRWIKERPKDKPFMRVGGFAGTGKTTLARHLAESVNGLVYFAAYTGKAAHVLIKSGAANVSTIHKLIYKPKDKSQQHLRDLQAERAALMAMDPVPEKLLKTCEESIHIEQINLSRPMFSLSDESPLLGAALLVVDEYSMIDRQMGEDLLTFGCPILALGDPGQLPPVYGEPFFQGPPEVMLTEIHRQAQDNPIIWMSKEVREGRVLQPGTYGTSRVIPYGRLPREELAAAVLSTDQLLCGKNATRISSNNRIRELMERRGPLPEQGDKLVCLRNNLDLGLLNGQLWRARADAVFDGDYAILDLEGDDAQRIEVLAHVDYFHGSKPDHWAKKDAEEFDYGNALTVHKSQGSQFNNVALLDEWYGRDRKEWLYTGITRASERIDIIQM